MLKRHEILLRHGASWTEAPTFCYMGAGAKHRAWKEWRQLVHNATKYIDLTAGSNNQPFLLARTLGIPVATNDGSYYSYCISRGLFRRRQRTSILHSRDLLMKISEKRGGGFLTKSGLLGNDPEVKRLCCFIDSWILAVKSEFSIGHREHLLACTGSAILENLTFRSMSWYPYRAGKKLITIAEMASAIISKTIQTNGHHEPGESFNLPAEKFIERYEGFEGASVSFDPAWPYASNAPNPYKLYDELGHILRQRKNRAYLWPNDVDTVLADIDKWISTCLDKGAKEVFLWNQTTNTPTKSVLKRFLSKRFKTKHVLNVKHFTLNKHLEFFDYVFRMTAK